MGGVGLGDKFDLAAQQSALLELTPDLVCSATPDGQLTYLNRGGRMLLGWPVDATLEGKRIADVHPVWASRLVLQEGIATAIAAGVWRGETAILTCTGEEIPVSQVIIAHADGAGRTAFLSTIMRDMRERKRIEEALRASTEMFQLVMNFIPQFVFWKDRDSVYQGCNANFARVAGVPSVADIVGKTDGDLAWKPEEAAFFREVDRRVMFGDAPELHIIEPQLQADGKQAWLDTNKIPLHDESGRVVGILGTYEDITARKLAEDALIEREENLRILLDSIGDAVIATNALGAVARMNPVAEQLTGFTSGEAHGLPLADVFRVEFGIERRVIAGPFSALLEDGSVGPATEVRILRARDGAQHFISERGAPMRDTAGGLIGLVLVFRDVTEQRAREQQLLHAQKMDSLGRLAGGIAHDFNNMLAAIAGSAELLLHLLRDDAKLSHVANTILAAADQAGGLTQKLLDFSRKGSSHRKHFDIHSVIDAACGMLSRTIDRNVHFSVQLDAGVHTGFGDPSQLQNALLNLGVNARDALPEGGTIRVVTANAERDARDCERSAFALEPGVYLELSFSDTGVGMDDEQLRRAFEPFYTTKDVGAGTGLGLSAVYNAVVDHRGSIEVASRIGQGTTFRLSLPVATNAQVSTQPEPAATPMGHGTVLVVDDEPMVRRSVAAMLRSLGYVVREADGGPAAIERFAREHTEIDVVLLDMVMPVMSGGQIFRALIEIDPRAVVIFTSGFTREATVDPGVYGFIRKPYRLRELAQLLASAIGSRHA